MKALLITLFCIIFTTISYSQGTRAQLDSLKRKRILLEIKAQELGLNIVHPKRDCLFNDRPTVKSFAKVLIHWYDEFYQDSLRVFTGALRISGEGEQDENGLVYYRTDSVFQWWYYRDVPSLENFVNWLDEKYDFKPRND